MKKIILICMLLMAVCLPGYAAGLDDSGEKKVTVRSEIVRGSEVAWNSMQASLDSSKRIDYILDTNKHNQQRNSDTDGYYLGAYCQSWILIPGFSGYENSQYMKDMTKIFFEKFREKQKQMGISDDDLLSILVDSKYINEFKAKIAQWESQPPK